MISDSSEVASRPETTPDDVVRVIGLNSFLSLQVQRLLVRSPEMLRRGNVASCKPSVYPAESKLKRKALSDNKKHDISDINPNVILKPFSSAPPPRAPGYQWLVPVRSRTEGLVYKPYPGPCPLAPGFIAPIHGSYGLPLPASDQQGIVNSYTGTYANGHSSKASISKQDSGTDLSTIPYQKIQKSRTLNQGRGTTIDALPLFPTKPMNQDKSALRSIIPYQKPNINPTIDALPLFPTRPVDRDQSKHQKIEVIKVVPHNRKSTSESAARIFRSMQEERKQHT